MSGISCHDICPHDRYKLLCGVVVPWSFALVTTLDENGAVNAAPFRFFNVFSDFRGNLYAYERDTLVMHRESQAQCSARAHTGNGAPEPLKDI
jgi:hypothetical protein